MRSSDVYAENVTNVKKKKKKENYDTFDNPNIAGNPISEPVYADDIVLVSKNHRGIQKLI